jgi:hypothetical protein
MIQIQPLKSEDVKLELFQDERHYCGVELKERNPRYRNKDKPWCLTIFANAYGTFEATHELSIDDAEAMRDWLSELLARLKK